MTVATEKTPRRLGRGLEALLGSATGLATSDEGALKSIPIGQVIRNPFQPRQEFDEAELTELEESLKASGCQPLPIGIARQLGAAAGSCSPRRKIGCQWREANAAAVAAALPGSTTRNKRRSPDPTPL